MTNERYVNQKWDKTIARLTKDDMAHLLTDVISENMVKINLLNAVKVNRKLGIKCPTCITLKKKLIGKVDKRL